MKLSVLSVGGSIIAPDGVNVDFLSAFIPAIKKYLNDNPDEKLIFVCGGGAPARIYQKGYRDVIKDVSQQDAPAQDWIGIRATHLNGELVKAMFGDLACDPLVTNPTSDDVTFNGKILVGGGWKPGFSTDTDSVILAKRFGADKVINLSNIKKVFSDDPKNNPNAYPLDNVTWADFRKIVGDEWVPGKNAPFDPIASKMAQESNLTVICADGRNIENTIAILEGKDFIGTKISG